MKVPRICKSCLTVVKAREIKRPRDMSEEEYTCQLMIDNQVRCNNCGGLLTQFIEKVIDRVTDPDVLKLFGVEDPKTKAVLVSQKQEKDKLFKELEPIEKAMQVNENAVDETRRLRRQEIIRKLSHGKQE